MNIPNEQFDRTRLQGLAYRITGSVCDAEDIVQDTWLRWQSCDRTSIQNPHAYLAKIATNLSMDKLRSRQKQRETYVGSWLPEPHIENDAIDDSIDPQQLQELSDDISIAFLLALEKLSPGERAAFILHDVLAYRFAEVAEILGRDSASCRKLATRARKALQTGPKRFIADGATSKKLAQAFQQAIVDGDLDELTELLSSNATFISDGGGKVAAVPLPVEGGSKIAKMLLGFTKTYRGNDKLTAKFAAINGLPGFVLWEGETVIQTLALQFDRDNLIESIYVVRNPEKLRHLIAPHKI